MDAAGIGSAIRHRRSLLGLTQQETADLAGIARKTLSDLEHGNGPRGATLSNAIAVCGVLGLSLRVVDGADSPE